VALVNFPFSANAEESYKKRPVLVLAAAGTPPDQAIFCAMITGNLRRFQRPGPGDIVLADWRASGLLVPSVVRTRRIWTAEGRDFSGVIGQVSHDVLQTVREEIARLLQLPR
jgi:hypothetical protein